MLNSSFSFEAFLQEMEQQCNIGKVCKLIECHVNKVEQKDVKKDVKSVHVRDNALQLKNKCKKKTKEQPSSEL